MDQLANLPKMAGARRQARLDAIKCRDRAGLGGAHAEVVDDDPEDEQGLEDKVAEGKAPNDPENELIELLALCYASYSTPEREATIKTPYVPLQNAEQAHAALIES